MHATTFRRVRRRGLYARVQDQTEMFLEELDRRHKARSGIYSNTATKSEDSHWEIVPESFSRDSLLLPAGTSDTQSGGAQHPTIPANPLMAGHAQQAMVQRVARANEKSNALPHAGHTFPIARPFRFAVSS